jgi:hypothetical protein
MTIRDMMPPLLLEMTRGKHRYGGDGTGVPR